MLKNNKNAQYSSPVAKICVWDENDVITSSGEDNLGGIPEGWSGLGGGF